MKKIIMAAAVLVVMAACNKTVIQIAPEEGTISLGLTTDTEVVVTKAEEESNAKPLADEDAKDYIISFTAWEKEKVFSAITDDDKRVPAGSYTMQAKNISDEAAVAGNGAMQLVSPATAVTVAAGENTAVTLACTVANSKITVATAAGFGNVFTLGTDPVLLSVSGREAVAMTPGAHDAKETEVAWFNVGTVTWTLKATVNSTEEVKTYSGTFDAAAAKWNQLTFSAGKDGTISLTITVDDTIEEVPVTELIDPLEGTTSSN